MGSYKRETVYGVTPMDIKKINDNTENLWAKVNGDINFVNMDNDMKIRINKQWLPFQGEGNLDSTHPLTIRMYIPPNVNSIENSTFSAIVSPYRMDSDVASASQLPINADVTSSVSSTKVSVSAGATNYGATTSWVNSWTSTTSGVSAPKNAIKDEENAFSRQIYYANGTSSFILESQYTDAVGALVYPLSMYQDDSGTNSAGYVDYALLQHVHSIPGHGHTVTATASPHDHEISVKASVPPHSHNLNEGIKDSTVQPQNVSIKINGTSVGSTMNSAKATQNDVIIPTDLVKIGQWNIIEATTSSLARISIYGVIELITQYNEKQTTTK